MKTELYLKIAIRIIILCLIGMAFTYVPEHLRSFFGDTLRAEADRNGIDTMWDWGTRHLWYAWTTFLLFLLTVINIIIFIFNEVEKYYPNAFKS